MKLSFDRQKFDVLRFPYGPEGSKVTFLVKSRADSWDRERVRILPRNTGESFRNAIESMVVGWEGVEDDNGGARGFAWEYLVALAEAEGFEGAISALAAFVLSDTNVARDTPRGTDLKKTPDGS